MDWIKRIVSFILALFISYVVFYSFFALMGLTFRLIFELGPILLMIIVALPFYVFIKKKIFK